MDSLHPDTFAQLTRRPSLDRVLRGIEEADRVGLRPIKINAVPIRAVNDPEATALLDWSLRHGFELRFIEQMPLDADRAWSRDQMVTASQIRSLLEQEFVLSPDPRQRDGAPADHWEVRRRSEPGAVLGALGIIASVTEPFCADCRRTRVRRPDSAACGPDDPSPRPPPRRRCLRAQDVMLRTERGRAFAKTACQRSG